MVLTGAWEAQVMTEEQVKQLHVGVPRMGKQFILDTFLDSVLHNCVRSVFFSYHGSHFLFVVFVTQHFGTSVVTTN